ncbi:MAG: thioredoxin [Candidatus Altiarchaeales archaeon ex4484_2]|nr:MAG: thioredoxin [Candidatus Altiarchaeales archaeon ex4484_2]
MTGKESIIDVRDVDFQERVINRSREKPVVVDFWAPWCQPCLMLSPMLESLAHENNGEFVLAKVNVDEARITAQIYGIRSIPSVKIFREGEVRSEFVGVMPKDRVEEILRKGMGAQ